VGFQSTTQVAIDEKGRVTVPKEIRDTLSASCAGQLTILRSPDGCLMLYPRHAWEAYKAEVMNWPFNMRIWSRILLGSATNVEFDTAGRIAIPPFLREEVKIALKGKVLLSGAGTHYEIWEPSVYREYEQTALSKVSSDDFGNMKF
jgi:MraZ protein